MSPDVDPSAWTPFLLPWRTLLRHGMPRPLPSYWLRRILTWQKMNMFIFRRSRIEAESKSNRNCNSRFKSKSKCHVFGTEVFGWCVFESHYVENDWRYRLYCNGAPVGNSTAVSNCHVYDYVAWTWKFKVVIQVYLDANTLINVIDRGTVPKDHL